MGHLNIGPVYRVGQVEIEHSSKTSLFQETEGENLQSGILDPLWCCVFISFHFIIFTHGPLSSQKPDLEGPWACTEYTYKKF